MKILAWITVSLTFILMVWGNMVSATGSGLACPDWPLCYGSILPPARFDIILEWGHRLIAFVTSLFILATILTLWRSSKKNIFLKGSTKTILGLLVLQILLGGVTVLLELSVFVSTVHLIIACLVFAGLILVASVATWEKKMVVDSNKKIQSHARVLAFAILIQLALGGLVRHGHAGLACPNFPMCLDSFFPIPFTLETMLAFVHRWWGVLLFVGFFHLFRATVKAKSKLKPFAVSLMLLVLFQIGLGIMTVGSALSTGTRGIHAAMGYALWGLIVYLAFRTGAFRFLWDGKKSKRTTTRLGSTAAARA